jgi:hypothetical protein
MGVGDKDADVAGAALEAILEGSAGEVARLRDALAAGGQDPVTLDLARNAWVVLANPDGLVAQAVRVCELGHIVASARACLGRGDAGGAVIALAHALVSPGGVLPRLVAGTGGPPARDVEEAAGLAGLALVAAAAVPHGSSRSHPFPAWSLAFLPRTLSWPAAAVLAWRAADRQHQARQAHRLAADWATILLRHVEGLLGVTHHHLREILEAVRHDLERILPPGGAPC